jgi:hypothetical protein
MLSVSPCSIRFPASVTPLNSRDVLSGGIVNGVPAACEKCLRFRSINADAVFGFVLHLSFVV